MKAYRHMPLFKTDDLKNMIPYDCIPVAIDLLDNAISLTGFTHPERAFYIFGAEDATLGARITDWCPHKVYIPTRRCMNLACTVHVVLYDRMVKQS
jgi:tRNA(Leu) C34 or U34 (ribose-2'-O)-methylase TrmL